MASVPSDEIKKQFFAALVGAQPDIVSDLVTQHPALVYTPIKVSDFVPMKKFLETLETAMDAEEEFDNVPRKRATILDTKEVFLPPLAITAMPDKDRKEIAEVLLKNGANVNTEFDALSFCVAYTRLHEDQEEALIQSTILLRGNQARRDVRITAVEGALILDTPELVNFFKSHGGLPTGEVTNNTILTSAIKRDDPQKVTEIIAARPELLDLPIGKCPPVIWATILNKPQYVKQLDDAGANLQQKVDWGDFRYLFLYLNPNDQDYFGHLEDERLGESEKKLWGMEGSERVPLDEIEIAPFDISALDIARILKRKEIVSYLEEKEKRTSPHANRPRPEQEIKDGPGQTNRGNSNDKKPGDGGIGQ